MNKEEIVKNKLYQVFTCHNQKVNLIAGVIELSTEDDFQELQKDFRFNDKGSIEDWIGENYYVIGIDSTMGDPYITDISKEELPIYMMYHDDWKSLTKISKDFNTFTKILNVLNECHLNLNSTIEDSKNALKKISEIESEYITYWQDILMISE